MLWVYKDKDGNFDYIKANSKPNSDAQLVDANLWQEPVQYLVASESVVEGKKIYSVSLDTGTKEAEEAAKAAEKARLDASKALDYSLAVKAIQAAGTSNLIAGLTDIFTYQAMKASPEKFDKEGIVAKKATLTFAKGDALDTILKVQTYADECMDEAVSYMITRLKDISEHINQGGE